MTLRCEIVQIYRGYKPRWHNGDGMEQSIVSHSLKIREICMCRRLARPRMFHEVMYNAGSKQYRENRILVFIDENFCVHCQIFYCTFELHSIAALGV